MKVRINTDGAGIVLFPPHDALRLSQQKTADLRFAVVELKVKTEDMCR